jgi:zinc transporter, ZIP family
VLSSAPQPVGAAIAYVLVEEVRSVLPWSLAFAAGAMLTVVACELIPDALESRAHAAKA